MTEILQTRLPYDPEGAHALPGISPLALADWLQVDEAFVGQMAERACLLSERRAEVLAVTDGAGPAAAELLQFVLDWLREYGQSYHVSANQVQRPDGVVVPVDRADPMGTLGQLVQEDLCLMERRDDEHVLTAAVLCFPASWHLADKIGRPLTTIHVPVKAYDESLARRVQRLFDGVQEGRPLWRFNALRYADATLHQPRSRVQPSAEADYPYLRSERQCVLRLPQTRACVFSIHTYILARAARD
ncbi:MAG: heme-dependent oxidative N-demethylase family protein [Roseovarius sp.]